LDHILGVGDDTIESSCEEHGRPGSPAAKALSFFDDKYNRVRCAANPFGARALAITPIESLTYVTGMGREVLARPERLPGRRRRSI
jgi:hypothetical protein